MQLSVTRPPLIQPQSPNRTRCLFSFIKGVALSGEVGNVSSAGGIFSSYGRHSAEMPQRLMEALIVDGGTRLLKTAAACSCSIALYSSLSPSPVLVFHRSLYFLFENPSKKIYPPLFGFAPFLRPGKQEGRRGALVSRRPWFIPAPRVAPAEGGRQMAHGAPRRPPHSWDCSLLKAHNGQLTQHAIHTHTHTHTHTHVQSDRTPIGAIFNFPVNVILQTLSSDWVSSCSL